MNDPDTIRYYRARAEEYEQIYYRDDPARQKELKDSADRLQSCVAGKQVLELACGTGYWTEVISRTAEHIVATDISEEMLAEAKKKRLDCPVSFVAADMFKLPLAHKTFDLVAVGFWFSHQPRQEYSAFFDCLLSRIGSDGQIWLIDNNPPAEGPVSNFVRRDKQGNSYKRRFLDNCREFVILKNYFSETELRETFESSFEIRSLQFGVYYWSAVLSPR